METTPPTKAKSSPPVVTLFADRHGKRIRDARPMSLAQIEAGIHKSKGAATKEELPLLKFASFGDKLSKQGSLRHDANVTQVSGIEGDYDGELVPMDDAVRTLGALGLAAVFYTSASHTPDKPRWRVLVELATPLTGSTDELRKGRAHWVGVLNAILGGVLKSESFALSQCFYYGPIAGRPAPIVVRLEGCRIDELPDAPAPVSAVKPNGTATPKPKPTAEAIGKDRSADLLKRVGSAVRAGLDDQDVHKLYDDHPHARDQGDPARAVQRCIDKVRAEAPPKEDEPDEPFPISLVLPVREYNALNLPKREEMIEQLVKVQSLIMIYAKRGVGKTMLAIYMAVCLATGRPFLKYYPVTRKWRVLYVDGEMAGADLQERLIKFCGDDVPEGLDILASEQYFSTMNGLMNLADPQQQVRFVGLLDALKDAGRNPDVIFLDNKSALTGGTEENSNSEQDAILEFLRALRHRGYTVIEIHHAGKGGDQRGASRNEDFLDLTIKLEEPSAEDDDQEDGVPAAPPPDGAAFRVSYTKVRGGKKPYPAIVDCELMEELGGAFEFLATAQKRKPNKVRVGVYLRDHQPVLTQTQIADALHMHKTNVGDIIKAMRQRNMLDGDKLSLSKSGLAYVDSCSERPKTAGDFKPETVGESRR